MKVQIRLLKKAGSALNQAFGLLMGESIVTYSPGILKQHPYAPFGI